MDKFDIPADQRLIARMVRSGTQKDAIRALLELITNSDDSYKRLEGEGKPHDGLIEVRYEKEGSCGLFTVRDAAEGMSYADLSAFRKYGGATSGLKEGKAVTGFFGTGAKNALAGMTDGRICTFKDNEFCEFRIFLRDDCLKGELESPHKASDSLRSRFRVNGNGTVAIFKADPKKGQQVPRFDTIFENLANHWRLRKIMSNSRRKVILVDAAEKNKKRSLHYPLPSGEIQVDKRVAISVANYGEFPITIRIRRAGSELRQEGDDRPGGLLIIDDCDATLDMSLFRYDREPLAARFFGEVVFGRFRELLNNEEPVLDEKRDGINRSHPVCAAAIAEIEKCIESLVQEESRRQREEQSKIDDEERTRYSDAFKLLNEIAEEETEEVTNLGQESSDQITSPPDGLGLYPNSVHVTVGKRYGIEVRIDTAKFVPGTQVRMSTSPAKLKIVGNATFKVTKIPKSGLMRRWITVQSNEAGIRAELQATIGKQTAKATIFVEPEKEENDYLLKHGLVFRPESVSVRVNRPRNALLRVYVKIIDGGSTITLKSDNDSVHFWPEEVQVKEADARRHIAEYPIEIWGDEPDATAMITAEYEGHDALLEVTVRLEEEKPRPKGQGMFFGEPYFDLEPEPLQRTSYSKETGQITIYANFPSIRHYLGENLVYRKTLSAQVLIADLIAERCFFEMARAKKRDVAISPEALSARIQRDAQELSKRYGLKLHKALVDSKLLRNDQTSKRGAD